MWEFGLDLCGKSSWSGGVLLASGMERMERAGSGYTAACTGFGVISLRSSQVGSGRELCSLRGVKSPCDVTLWMLWAEKGKGFFFQGKFILCCVTTVLLGEAGWGPGKRWVLQVSVSLRQPLCSAP